VVAVAVGGGDLPEAAGEEVDAVDAGARVKGSSLLCGEVGHGGVEVGERLRGMPRRPPAADLRKDSWKTWPA
jgi:hypothetical protein